MRDTYYVEAYKKGQKHNPNGLFVWNNFEGYNVKGDTTRKFKTKYPNYVIKRILKN